LRRGFHLDDHARQARQALAYLEKGRAKGKVVVQMR
jgi:hypothetical protein